MLLDGGAAALAAYHAGDRRGLACGLPFMPYYGRLGSARLSIDENFSGQKRANLLNFAPFDLFLALT